jgi:hypothetical protein
LPRRLCLGLHAEDARCLINRIPDPRALIPPPRGRRPKTLMPLPAYLHDAVTLLHRGPATLVCYTPPEPPQKPRLVPRIDPKPALLGLHLARPRISSKMSPPVSSSASAIPHHRRFPDLSKPCNTDVALPRVEPWDPGARAHPVSTRHRPPPVRHRWTSTATSCTAALPEPEPR